MSSSCTNQPKMIHILSPFTSRKMLMFMTDSSLVQSFPTTPLLHLKEQLSLVPRIIGYCRALLDFLHKIHNQSFQTSNMISYFLNPWDHQAEYPKFLSWEQREHPKLPGLQCRLSSGPYPFGSYALPASWTFQKSH